jgi:ribonuclease HI
MPLSGIYLDGLKNGFPLRGITGMTCYNVELAIYTDGVSRNNPGEAGAGIYILRNGRPVEWIALYLGTTNNITEYTPAIHGLEEALKQGATSIKLYADSELLMKQSERPVPGGRTRG